MAKSYWCLSVVVGVDIDVGVRNGSASSSIKVRNMEYSKPLPPPDQTLSFSVSLPFIWLAV